MVYTANGSALTEHVTFARFLNDGTLGQYVGANYPVTYQYGEKAVPDKYYKGANLLLEVGLPHATDGEAHEHLSALQNMFGGNNGTFVTLVRDDHPAGTVRTDVEYVSAQPTQDRFTYAFTLRAVDGVWEDNTTHQASGTAPVIATLGDRPIGDPLITFSAPGTATLVTDWGTSTMGWEGTGTAIVRCGERTIRKAGVHQDAFLTVDQPWWFRFAPNTTVNLTSSVSITVDWRNKYA